MRKLLIGLLLLLAVPAGAADWPVSSARAGFGFNLQGKPITGSIRRYVALWSYSIPANYTAAGAAPTSLCSCKTAPTDGNYIIAIYKNASAEGTCTVNTGANTGTFAANAAFTLAPGDTISIVAPTQDSTGADCSVSIGASQ
jgi:hypothetical protein